MNDSFLEDLGIIPGESAKVAYDQADRHITTRHTTSSPLLRFSEQVELENVAHSQKGRSASITVPDISDIKTTSNKDASRDSKRQSDQSTKRHSAKIKEKSEKVESRAKHLEFKIKMDNNKHQDKEAKMKIQGTRQCKAADNKTMTKDYNHRSKSHNAHCVCPSTKESKCSPDSSNMNFLDISSKENSRPSDHSRESGSHDLTKEKEKLQANLKRSDFNIQDQDPVALLTAIKELISTYTKQESSKILHTMQELHVNSQATLIKNLLYQTDDLIKEMHPSKDSTRTRILVEENERLRQELLVLRVRNEDLQSKLEEFEFLKQENVALRLKCNEQI